MTDLQKLTIRTNSQELYDTVGSLYSDEFADGMMKLPKELHKYRDTIARVYNLSENLDTYIKEEME